MNKLMKKSIACVLAFSAMLSAVPATATKKIAESDEWHTSSDLLFSEDFEKEFTWGKTATGTAPIPYPETNSTKWQGNSGAKGFRLSAGVADPTGGDDGMLKITLPYSSAEGEIQKSFWLDHAKQPVNDTKKGITVFEQSLYFDSDESFVNGRRDEDYFMCQLYYPNDTSGLTSFIAYVIRPDGITSVSLNSAPTGNGILTLPRDEWIKLITVIDYDNNKWYVYLKEADGTVTNITSANYSTSYTKAMQYARFTYTDMPGEGESSWVGVGCANVYKYSDKKDFWKKYADVYWEEDFDGKGYAAASTNGGTRHFKDSSGADYFRYNSKNVSIETVKDPSGADNEAVKLTATQINASTASYIWYDQSNPMPQGEDLDKEYIYEQKYYLTDNSLENSGNIMWQMYDKAGSNGKIAFVAWKDGFNTSNTSSAVTDGNKYILPKNEWFTLRGVVNYKAGKIDFYVIKSDGTKDFVFTNTLNSAQKNGIGKVRATYSVKPDVNESNSLYIDDIYYYTLNPEKVELPAGYIGMTGEGEAKLGNTIKVNPTFKDNKAPYNYKIQWYRAIAGMYNYIDGTVKMIEGATGTSYTVTDADKGCYLFAKLIADGDSIAEGVGEIEVDTYPGVKDEKWGVGVGESFFKKVRTLFFEENYDDKAYAWEQAVNSGTKYFNDSDGNTIWKFNTSAMLATAGNDPSGRGGKAFKITAPYSGTDTTKHFWYDHNIDLKHDDMNKLHVYEQEIYLDDKALTNGGHIMAQFMHTNNTGRILYVLRDDGVNVSNTNATPVTEYKLPRNEWFKVVTILDYQSASYIVKIFEAGGDVHNVLTGTLSAEFKTNGTMRVRNTYSETVTSAFSDSTVYFDNAAYYSTDEMLAAVHNLRIGGENRVGKVIKAEYDKVGDVLPERDMKFQWYRADSKEPWDFSLHMLGEDEMLGENFKKIEGATGDEYIPTKADEGKYIKLEAVFTSPDGGRETMWTQPWYIRPAVDYEITNPEITLSDGTKAAVNFKNNTDSRIDAVMVVAKYSGEALSGVKFASFGVDGNKEETIRKEFEVGNVADTDTLKLMVIKDWKNITPLFEGITMTAGDIRSIPVPEIVVSGDDVSVLWNGESILDIIEGRYLTFRSTTENDHWIGTKYKKGTDMGFSYQEDNICGIINQSIETSQDDWSFKIVLEGKKAIVDATQTNIIEGRWNPEMKGFEYKYTGIMRANDTEDYHKNSTAGWANTGMVEFLDYFLERMSIQDRTLNNNTNGDLYDYIGYELGGKWNKLPKLSVFYDYLREGKYFVQCYLNEGDKIAMLDANANGWTSELLYSSHDMLASLCWSWYDVHYLMHNAIPALGSCDNFEVSASWLFKPTSAEYNREVIEEAVEPDWRNSPNYQLPRYSTDWNNKFDEQVGGTEWEDGMAWSRTDYDAYWDKEVGYDDNYSVAFDRDENSKKASTWFNSCYFGFPGEFMKTRGKTFRVSAMVKTENLTGEAKLCVVNGRGRFTIPGYIDNGDPASSQLQYVYADSLTGTNDWTPVRLEFTGIDGNAVFYLTYIEMIATGEGKAWFDNVKIECISE